MSLGMLVKGQWQDEWTEHDEKGNFKRMPTQFKGDIDEVTLSDKGRYVIYISYGCPWASRVAMTYELLGLNDFVSLNVVVPKIGEKGWFFDSDHKDSQYQFKYLYELYLKNDSNYSGRVTVPVLWDSHENKIINNESIEIIQILNKKFRSFAQNKNINLFPEEEKSNILAEINYNYEAINNACYRTGFAQSQEAYESEVIKLFKELEFLDIKLSERKYLVGDKLSGADICLLPSLLRFDVAYYFIFKCNFKKLRDFENIEKYMDRLLNVDEIKKTFKVDHIKSIYYSIPALNPSGIIPVGP